METLGQMISYDDMSDTLQIYETAHVEDSPSYSHRGVLLDTSRNFITKKVKLSVTNAYVNLLGVGYQADHLRDVLRQAQRVPLAHHRHPQLPLLLEKGASAHDAWSVQPAPGVHPRGHQGHRGICTSQVILSPPQTISLF